MKPRVGDRVYYCDTTGVPVATKHGGKDLGTDVMDGGQAKVVWDTPQRPGDPLDFDTLAGVRALVRCTAESLYTTPVVRSKRARAAIARLRRSIRRQEHKGSHRSAPLDVVTAIDLDLSRIRGVIFVPAAEDPGKLVAEGPCHGFPPLAALAWPPSAKRWGIVAAEKRPETPPKDEVNGLPLWWDGALVPDSWLRALWVSAVSGRGINPFPSLLEMPDFALVLKLARALEAAGFGRVVLLGDNRQEVFGVR